MLAINAVATWAAGELFGHQLVGGIGSTANGVGAIGTGVSLMAFGPWGIAAGILLIGVGTATAAFGINEVVDHYSGTNYIQSWGINASVYNGLYVGLNIVSGIGQIAGNVGMRYVANAKLSAAMKKPELIQTYNKFQFKTYARYSNEWKLLAARNGKGMRALSTVNKGNSIRYGHGINNAEHFYEAYYWIVTNGFGKYRFSFI